MLQSDRSMALNFHLLSFILLCVFSKSICFMTGWVVSLSYLESLSALVNNAVFVVMLLQCDMFQINDMVDTNNMGVIFPDSTES